MVTMGIYGIGNPLMDFVTNQSFEFLKNLNALPGTMNLIDQEKSSSILESITQYRNIPGGSCANTLRGVSWLANALEQKLSLYFSGSLGDDEIGKKYEKLLKTLGITPLTARKKLVTGSCVAVVTPDFERTMFTYLGASAAFNENDIDYETLGQCTILHFTGYMWGTPEQRRAVQKAVDLGRSNGVKISFDIADPFVVQNNQDEFLEWIPKHVDLLFGNRTEIQMLLGRDDEDSSLAMRAGSLAPQVVMKAGASGCYVNHNGHLIYSKGFPVDATDTVGAGDSFASGYLFAYLLGKSEKDCAALANKVASAIVTVPGCDFEAIDGRKVILELL
ncbi:MAG: adenosine kinase [Spirochaetales bacterium]|nr:adenosine kinase [Spirochaetales bacterium]